MQKLTCLTLALTAFTATAACSSPRQNVTQQDPYGNYVTTSDYRSMERAEFQEAMRAGLVDFDQRVTQLRERANELGGDSLKEFSDWAEDLDEKRTEFVNELEKTEASLATDWPDRHEDTLDSYEDMRDALNEAYEEVLAG